MINAIASASAAPAFSWPSAAPEGLTARLASSLNAVIGTSGRPVGAAAGGSSALAQQVDRLFASALAPQGTTTPAQAGSDLAGLVKANPAQRSALLDQVAGNYYQAYAKDPAGLQPLNDMIGAAGLGDDVVQALKGLAGKQLQIGGKPLQFDALGNPVPPPPRLPGHGDHLASLQELAEMLARLLDPNPAEGDGATPLPGPPPAGPSAGSGGGAGGSGSGGGGSGGGGGSSGGGGHAHGGGHGGGGSGGHAHGANKKHAHSAEGGGHPGNGSGSGGAADAGNGGGEGGGIKSTAGNGGNGGVGGSGGSAGSGNAGGHGGAGGNGGDGGDGGSGATSGSAGSSQGTGIAGATSGTAGGSVPKSMSGLSQMNLQLPTGSDGHMDTVKGDSLPSYNSQYFQHNGDGIKMFAPVTGVHSAGSENPRCELAQGATWSLASGAHTMSATMSVDQLPSSGEVCIGQIHQRDGHPRPPVMLKYDHGTISVSVMDNISPNSKRHDEVIATNVPLGQKFSYSLSTRPDGQLTVSAAGQSRTLKLDPSFQASHMYFKSGVYVGDHEGNAQEGGAVTLSGLEIS